jgi:hypothetical protein
VVENSDKDGPCGLGSRTADERTMPSVWSGQARIGEKCALLRGSLALRTLAPLQPLALAHPRLEVWCNRGYVLASGNHSATHLVAVCVHYEVVSIMILAFNRYQCLHERCRNNVRPENTLL